MIIMTVGDIKTCLVLAEKRQRNTFSLKTIVCCYYKLANTKKN